MSEEIWKPVVGYEGLYEVSNLGKIFSVERLDSMGRKQGGIYIKCGADKDGYKLCILMKYGNRNTLKVHRVVLQAFIPNHDKKLHVNHKNGIKDDNRLENLEWVTPSENSKHMYRVLNRPHPRGGTGKRKFGKDNKLSKKVAQYDANMNLINIFDGLNEAGRIMGIPRGNISKACNGKIKTIKGYIWRYYLPESLENQPTTDL